MAIAVLVTSALYLGLAATTISVLGTRTATDAPLAMLLRQAVGPAGTDAAAAAAAVLTLGATNAYISGAAAIAAQLAPAASGRPRSAPKLRLLASITGAGIVLITLYGLRVVSIDALVAVPTTLFLMVYLGAMVAGARLLPGRVAMAARLAAAAVTIMLGFCGWALAIPAAVALAASWRGRADSRGTALPSTTEDGCQSLVPHVAPPTVTVIRAPGGGPLR